MLGLHIWKHLHHVYSCSKDWAIRLRDTHRFRPVTWNILSLIQSTPVVVLENTALIAPHRRCLTLLMVTVACEVMEFLCQEQHARSSCNSPALGLLTKGNLIPDLSVSPYALIVRDYAYSAGKTYLCTYMWEPIFWKGYCR